MLLFTAILVAQLGRSAAVDLSETHQNNATVETGVLTTQVFEGADRATCTFYSLMAM
jgi:hypothetical protein